MTKNIIVYGLIAGIIVSVLMLFSIGNINDLNIGLAIGYASMLLAFSLVFVGIKNYRDKYNGGVISFGKAFKIGIMIVLIASTMYVISWLINYFFFIPDYMEKYAASMLDQLKASGTSQAEIDKQAKEMASFNARYKNPFFNALITYTEILPVGLAVTLISSFILKRKSTNQ
jgi:hypothetical protein